MEKEALRRRGKIFQKNWKAKRKEVGEDRRSRDQRALMKTEEMARRRGQSQ